MGSRDMQQGFVLPMTLIVLALLTVLSMGLSQMARNNMHDAQLRKDLFNQELVMRGDAQWVLYHLLVGTVDKGELDSGKLRLPLNGSVIERNGMKIHIQDSAGLLGLSFYRQETFERLLEKMTDKKTAMLLAARLGDWVDRDQITRYQGMEAKDYIKSGLPMRPRNAPIRSLDELLDLPGMTAELYNGFDGHLGLRDLLLAGGEGHFNLVTAPEILVGPALGISGAKLQRVIDLRQRKAWALLYNEVAGNVLFADESFSPYSPGSQYRMIIDAEDGASLRAMFALEPYAKVPYKLMLWQYPDFARGQGLK